MVYRSKDKNMYFRRKSPIPKILFWIGIILLICGIVFVGFKYKVNYTGVPRLKTVYSSWAEKNYEEVFNATGEILNRRPYDGEALAMRGFSAYYIFAEQTDFSSGYSYLDDAILCLRQAMYRVSKAEKSKIAYVLGKAYYQKGYYYADLALKYLNYAHEAGFQHNDLAEFRGMAAALLGEPEKAIEAFTLALADNPSDLVLFALAKNYGEIKDSKNTKLYLYETINRTKDVLLELKCRYLLGRLFLDEGLDDKAEKEFYFIIEKDKTSSDAYYGLGLVYEFRGDLIKARAQWRQALKLDPLHEETRVKLNKK